MISLYQPLTRPPDTAGQRQLAELDVPAINAAMKAAAVTPIGPERNKAWARIDHMIAEQAPAVPYLWDNIAAVQSKDVVGVINGYYTTHDLDYTSIR